MIISGLQGRVLINTKRYQQITRDLLYGYRCQICGKLIGEPYGTDVAESHHIDYYVRSMNNDANNQIILCPNHHSIIHAAEPEFRRDSLSFMYPNGFVEGLAINLHLR